MSHNTNRPIIVASIYSSLKIIFAAGVNFAAKDNLPIKDTVLARVAILSVHVLKVNRDVARKEI